MFGIRRNPLKTGRALSLRCRDHKAFTCPLQVSTWAQGSPETRALSAPRSVLRKCEALLCDGFLGDGLLPSGWRMLHESRMPTSLCHILAGTLHRMGGATQWAILHSSIFNPWNTVIFTNNKIFPHVWFPCKRQCKMKRLRLSLRSDWTLVQIGPYLHSHLFH